MALEALGELPPMPAARRRWCRLTPEEITFVESRMKAEKSYEPNFAVIRRCLLSRCCGQRRALVYAYDNKTSCCEHHLGAKRHMKFAVCLCRKHGAVEVTI